MIAFFLIAISLFTAASDYAGGLGVSRARQLVAELPGQPAIVLFSQHDLTSRPSASRGRGAPALLPRQWSRYGDSPAILLAESNAILLDFYPGTAAPASSPAAR